jgi:hypothetical protein
VTTRASAPSGLSWAPDGSALAYECKGGIWVMRVGNLAQRGCGAVTAPARIADGIQLVSGPADIGPGAGGGGGGGAERIAVDVAPVRGQRLDRALKRGLRVRVALQSPGDVRVTATIDRAAAHRLRAPRTVAGAHAEISGSRVVTLRFTRAARRALRRARYVRMRVRATSGAAHDVVRLTLRR